MNNGRQQEKNTPHILAIVTPVFPPYRSGQGTVARENARMAAECGYKTIVYTPWYRALQQEALQQETVHIEGGYETPHGEDSVGMNHYRVKRVTPLFAYGNAAFTPRLFWELRNAGIIHLHYPALGLELPVLFWNLFGKKLIVTYHMDLIGQTRTMRVIFFFYSKIILPMILLRASKVFVSSLDYAVHSLLLKPFFSAIEKKIVELPNSVDKQRFSPDKKETRLLSDISDDDDIILFVGALDSAHYSKGISVLLEAFALLKHNAKLVIIGDGDLRAEYERKARERGIIGRVFFAGSVSHEELPVWYAHARCIVLPSTGATEAFGVVLIEGAACGTPGIASRLPGVRSVIEDGVTGFLVEPHNTKDLAEKITILLTDHERSRAMGRSARLRVVERYAHPVVAGIYCRSLQQFQT